MAMKSGDRMAVGALRSTLSAIENAEAVEMPQGLRLAIGDMPTGVGAADVRRRDLTEADVEQIVRAEVTDRETAAGGYESVGKPERAEHLKAEVRVLQAFLS